MKNRAVPSRKNRKSVYLENAVFAEACGEARRLNDSVSGVFQMAWIFARDRFSRLPTVEHPTRRRAA